jgi:hypothetical protein
MGKSFARSRPQMNNPSYYTRLTAGPATSYYTRLTAGPANRSDAPRRLPDGAAGRFGILRDTSE